MGQVSIRLPDADENKLKAEAKARGVSIAELCRSKLIGTELPEPEPVVSMDADAIAEAVVAKLDERNMQRRQQKQAEMIAKEGKKSGGGGYFWLVLVLAVVVVVYLIYNIYILHI